MGIFEGVVESVILHSILQGDSWSRITVIATTISAVMPDCLTGNRKEEVGKEKVMLASYGDVNTVLPNPPWPGQVTWAHLGERELWKYGLFFLVVNAWLKLRVHSDGRV